MKSVRCLGLAIVLLLSGLDSHAADPEISERKRALVRELLDVTGARRLSEQISSQMIVMMRQSYPKMLEDMVRSQPDLSDSQRAALRSRMASFDRFAQKFGARFPEAIDFDALVESIYVPLYDKYFSEEELAEIIAFYRTPAGQKAISVAPKIMEDGYPAVMEQIQPRISEIVLQIVAEERAEVLDAAP